MLYMLPTWSQGCLNSEVLDITSRVLQLRGYWYQLNGILFDFKNTVLLLDFTPLLVLYIVWLDLEDDWMTKNLTRDQTRHNEITVIFVWIKSFGKLACFSCIWSNWIYKNTFLYWNLAWKQTNVKIKLTIILKSFQIWSSHLSSKFFVLQAHPF